MAINVWRICYNKTLGLGDLAFGSTLAPMRWHLPPNMGGAAVIYAGSSRALCQLEKRVHANDVAPVDQALIRLELPDNASTIEASTSLDAKRWRKDEGYTQTFGVAWLKGQSSLAMWVPSFVEPREMNLLINPTHPEFPGIKVVIEEKDFQFDPRLFDSR